MEEACKKFPEQYTADVDSSDLKSEELEKEIEELENNITHVQSLQRELHHFPVPKLVKQILMHQNQKSLTRDLEAKRELEQKLQKLQDFHTSSPTIFSEISALKATIDQGVAQANQSWNASTGQFTIPSGKKMDWANTIKNSWATRDKRLMEKQLKEYQIYAVIYNDKDGKPKIIWKVTKDGAGVKNPKIYQYLNANGKDLPADLFEFMSQHDWDDKVKVAFRNGKDLQIGDKYNPVLGALVASGQYLEDAYKFMTEDELGQALQMLGFNFASYRLATNKGTKTVENKKGSGANQKVVEEITNPILEAPRSGSGLKVDDIKPVKGKGSVYDIDPLTGKPPTKQTQIIIDEFPNVPKAHVFSDIIDNYAGLAEVTDLGNAKLYQIQGIQNGVMGRFEWIIQDEKVTHRMFVRNPELNGVPIK
ncbi:hypothetical protein ATZ33_12380 [Enterococcus silesiacus]|uniref:LXG domain-containing protein n=2 Tax=Enterococcus silesiacus TaxID=332949 RepID=A0ABM5WA95_9ENTE|nr:hypothetical protein ATZ33_12380 [Enterococcus silesiacus]